MKLHFSHTSFQEKATDFIRRSLENQVLPHGILIGGERGMGQSAFLLDLARILLCEGKDIKPCGQCGACQKKNLAGRDNLTVLLPLPEPSQKTEEGILEGVYNRLEILCQDPFSYESIHSEHISILQVRSLKKKLGYAEVRGRVRVVLIVSLEHMMEPAANALLKILEEPPENTYLLMSTENRDFILPTLLSRSMPLFLSPYSEFQLKEFVESREAIAQEALPLIPYCGGAPGRLLRFVQGEGRRLLSIAEAFLKTSQSDDWREVSDFLSSTPEFGDREKSIRILGFALELVRSRVADAPPSPELHHFVDYLNKAIDSISKYAKPEVALLGGWLSHTAAP